MEKKKALFTLDPRNANTLFDIMEKYGDSEVPYVGKNVSGETVEFHVAHDSIIVFTFQKNGWLREDVYTKNGPFIEREELYKGRWKPGQNTLK